MAVSPVFWLVALPLAAGPVVYLIGRLPRAEGEPRVTLLSRWVSLLALLAAWVPFVGIARTVGATGPVTVRVEAVTLHVDGLSLVLAATVLALGTLVVLYSNAYMAGE